MGSKYTSGFRKRIIVFASHFMCIRQKYEKNDHGKTLKNINANIYVDARYLHKRLI